MLNRVRSLADASQSIASRSGSGNGSRCSIVAFKTLNMTLLAPMPSDSVRTATAVKPGAERSVRIA